MCSTTELSARRMFWGLEGDRAGECRDHRVIGKHFGVGGREFSWFAGLFGAVRGV